MRATRRTVLEATGAGLAAGLVPFPGRTAQAAAARVADTTPAPAASPTASAPDAATSAPPLVTAARRRTT